MQTKVPDETRIALVTEAFGTSPEEVLAALSEHDPKRVQELLDSSIEKRRLSFPDTPVTT